MGYNNMNNSYPMCFSLPRTKAGKTAVDGCNPMSVSCLAGMTIYSNGAGADYKLWSMQALRCCY
jgi:hypothetical protein